MYEAPTRVVAALADMVEIWGDRDAFLCREATKVHEEYVRGSLSALRDRLAERAEVKGEIVLVVEGAPETEAAADGDAETVYAALAAEGLTRREAVKETARRLGLPAREVYRRVLEERREARGRAVSAAGRRGRGRAPRGRPSGKGGGAPAS